MNNTLRMKKLHLLYIILMVFLCVSCSSPENEGKELAQWMNDCTETFIKDKQKAETSFVNGFNASHYSSRTEALEAYDQVMIEVLDEYNSCHDEVVVKRSKIAGEYANDYKKMATFETAYESNIDSELSDKLMDAIAETDYPAAVLAKVKTIIPVKPDAAQIQKDLVGQELPEGYEGDKSWFAKDWHWLIKEGQIKNFNIEEIVKDDSKKYCVLATMRLEGDINAFDAQVKISYWLPDAEDWKIEYVNSLGMDIVKTHEYDDCVSYEIKDDGWGGVNALFITNKTKITLGVCGYFNNTYGDKRKFAVKIGPNETMQVGGTFGGGSVVSYDIVFVERI